MDYALRFIWVTLLTSCATSVVAKVVWPSDHPWNTAFHDWVCGVGVWSIALLVALYDLLRLRRENRRSPLDPP